jgi:beta-lactamase superfamily II metal-dependent hydrolase
MGLLIDMIDVGQGDSFLLTIDYPAGEAYALLDAGLPDAGPKVLDYVNQYAPTGLDMVIATHIDNDHVGGLATILTHAAFKQGAQFLLNVPPAINNHWTPVRNTLEKYKGIVSFQKVIDAVDTVKTLSALANKRGLVITPAMQGNYWTCGDVRLNVLNPTAERLAEAWKESRLDTYIQAGWDSQFVSAMESFAEVPPTSAENDSSIVIEIILKGRPIGLMCSDAGAAVLKEVTANKQYQFLKVPHHGSETGLDEELIQQIRPVYAAIPVGDNPHGHPSTEILDLLRENGATTYCSSKTKNCRRLCTFKGGNVSFPFGRAGHPGWVTIDKTQCKNNAQPKAVP